MFVPVERITTNDKAMDTTQRAARAIAQLQEKGIKRPTVNGVILQSLFNTGGTLGNEDAEEIERVLSFSHNGSYTISNGGGYLVEVDPSGDAARLEINEKGSNHYVLTDWLEIEYVHDEGGGDEDEMSAVIDPEGYNVPLSLVMRLNA